LATKKFDEFAQLPEQLFWDLPSRAGFPSAFDGMADLSRQLKRL